MQLRNGLDNGVVYSHEDFLCATFEGGEGRPTQHACEPTVRGSVGLHMAGDQEAAFGLRSLPPFRKKARWDTTPDVQRSSRVTAGKPFRQIRIDYERMGWPINDRLSLSIKISAPGRGISRAGPDGTADRRTSRLDGGWVGASSWCHCDCDG